MRSIPHVELPMLHDLTRLCGPMPNAGEMIFEVMILACVIDGAATHREIALLKQARRTVDPSDAWHGLDDDDVELHNAMLDHRVEERVYTWAKTIGDGISIFVSLSEFRFCVNPFVLHASA